MTLALQEFHFGGSEPHRFVDQRKMGVHRVQATTGEACRQTQSFALCGPALVNF